ncbi:MAG: reductive dehalogenase [SAR324 cluster bacterium]|nr:reductive dehalogenase [SAR324 cluster bacterium]
MVKPEKHPAMGDRNTEMSAEEASIRIKGFTKALGADKVGIAKLDPRWIYSHRGEIFGENWDGWGKEIHLDHPYAIVFLEEMSFEMVHAAPHTPTLIESMKNYSKGAVISTQLAAFIANFGYSAHANHLRHYETMLVPLAVDAGLGELGRHGYLMSKEFGSRARISAVTTNMPIIPDKPIDIGVEDFCKICKKCAHACPSNSIPNGEQTESNGLLRWKLDAESCFKYWGKIGTDCDICMRVCPWSHTRTLSHRIIVELTSRNRLARKLFTKLDDVFYGKRPVAGPPPEWADFMKKRDYRERSESK